MEGDAFSNSRTVEAGTGAAPSAAFTPTGIMSPVQMGGASSPPYRPLGDIHPSLLSSVDVTSRLLAEATPLLERAALSQASETEVPDTPGSVDTPASRSRGASSRRLSPGAMAGSISPGKGFLMDSDPDTVILSLLDTGKVVTSAHSHSASTGEGTSTVPDPSDWVGGSVPADSLEAPAWRLEPETVHPSVQLKRNFAWNPWTKSYVPLERGLRIKRLWCWQSYNLNWWTAFLFLLGSMGFFIGACVATSNISHSADHVAIKLYAEMLPYLAGGICFVLGALTLCISTSHHITWDKHRDDPDYEPLLNGPGRGAIQPTPVQWMGKWEVSPAVGEGPVDAPVQLPRRESSGCRMRSQVAAEEEFQRRWIAYDPWARQGHVVELVGAILVFLGTLFYKMGLFSDLYQTLSPGSIPVEWRFWLLEATIMAGSTAFVVGAYLLCASYGQAWIPWRMLVESPRTASLSWWTVILNMAGSLLFLVGAMPLSTPSPLPTLVSPSYVQNFFGWGLGSVLFFVQSWLMIIEVACAEDDEAPDDESDLRL
mmetsp:Transcript_37468/g.105800  ORF Transcript_37468/g.105800 Transcript_37468/m.105800 type:complete len:540 (-) Transcript_37468:85-1704(-)|eukprot:CAMPEP_0117658782 /NCGR_PEP_ID=MMETSP0804-20121206/6052_1 /TAXON_ID=1074897 /ORGANISM="Tetraselmis astigmatica, Strain CCMP880" /LENGTH=539 /DNA_ID=CAMNT_0005465335 /DNA_START=537 /DNA_END=2156 /DNA_ORIENTATION=-